MLLIPDLTTDSVRHPGRTLVDRTRHLGLALAVLACAVVLPACGGDEVPDPDSDRIDEAAAPDVPPDPMEGLQLTVGLEHLEFQPGAAIVVTLQLSNWGDTARTLSYRTSQRFDLILTDADGNEVDRWSHDRAFTQAISEERVEAGEDGELWEAEIHAPEEPGSYHLEAVLLPAEGELRMSVPIEVTGEG